MPVPDRLPSAHVSAVPLDRRIDFDQALGIGRHVCSKGLKTACSSLISPAGFKDAWQSCQFETIVEMARRVPEAMIPEDPALILYYDNAL